MKKKFYPALAPIICENIPTEILPYLARKNKKYVFTREEEQFEPGQWKPEFDSYVESENLNLNSVNQNFDSYVESENLSLDSANQNLTAMWRVKI